MIGVWPESATGPVPIPPRMATSGFTRSGRCVPTPFELSGVVEAVTLNGLPDVIATRPFNRQPPASAAAMPWFNQRRPLPNGDCATQEAVK